MTSAEAIKEQQDYLHQLNLDIPYKVREGMELGCEALEAYVKIRSTFKHPERWLLPSETEK